MSDKLICNKGDMVAALRYALRDPNEGAEIDEVFANFLFTGDEASTDSAREYLFELLEHYKKSERQP